MDAYERLLLPENLDYAWLKAKRLYLSNDGYIDTGEVFEFELDLERRLKRIRRRFEEGSYHLKSLRPLPRPKKLKDEQPIDRQFFSVSVDDQVAWIAITNALGPELDRQMPPWSYGNRLFRSAWIDKGEGRNSKLEIGPYRHASGHLYRPFQHSWPLFRRHIVLTAQAMAEGRPTARDNLDHMAIVALEAADAAKLPYLRRKFWKLNSRRDGSNLYHASIDLKLFYPSIKSNAILNGLMWNLADSQGRMRKLLSDMLRFRINNSGMRFHSTRNVEPPFPVDVIDGVPTGLFVAGFLANAAMLPVDLAVHERVQKIRSIAHFRFVDDHTVLAYDFDELCSWIESYQKTLEKFDIGPQVNHEKYDPEVLCKFLLAREKWDKKRGEFSDNDDELRKTAINGTKIDGSNPTRLMTKTLEQVSAIATTDIHILDDNDLQDRLKILKWLLLADIPEREIKPDTRAAFAAGQIAALVPVLIQEGDGLVDEARQLARMEREASKSEVQMQRVPSKKLALMRKRERVQRLLHERSKKEQRDLKSHFALILQAFREFPGKTRLFYRLHQYCRLTGYKGLVEIGDCIVDMRQKKQISWADYYAGLSLQMLSDGIPKAVRTIISVDSLRSEVEASYSYLEDIAMLSVTSFSVPQPRVTWFQVVVRAEFAVSLLTAAAVFKSHSKNRLGNRLEAKAAKFNDVNLNDPSPIWVAKTGWPAGVWAHRVEAALSIDGRPSPVWLQFAKRFVFDDETVDRLAVRRYPETVSTKAWRYFLDSRNPLDETDSGWLREVMVRSSVRIEQAAASTKKAFSRAARSFDPPGSPWITLSEWTDFIREECSPFDPRRSEWTALEIIRRVASLISNNPEKGFDRLHPNNVLVDKNWKTAFQASNTWAPMNWEEWRTYALRDGFEDHSPVIIRASAQSIFDYRYFALRREGGLASFWERNLHAIGRLLLGTVSLDHKPPRLWNIRGNEYVTGIPRARLFRSLAISSPTFLLIEGCLSARSLETRAIFSRPSFFGWDEGVPVNDLRFDPPALRRPDDLLRAIGHAQELLVRNQIAVSRNQPRQLVPFHLKDFASGSDNTVEEYGFDE